MPDEQLRPPLQASSRPLDALMEEAVELGVEAPPGIDREGLERLLLDRIQLIDGCDRGALLDLAAWADVSVADNPTNVDLVRRVLPKRPDRLAGLSSRGLRLLAGLRGLPVSADTPREELVRMLGRQSPFWDVVRRRRRQIIGSILGRAFDAKLHKAAADGAARNELKPASLKKRIEEEGVVSGIARTIRGAADDYVAEKLEEIERRIDVKLDEIDRRLCEWRDREVSNRLKILKITLIFSILVALVSLGYDYVRSSIQGPYQPTATAQRVDQ